MTNDPNLAHDTRRAFLKKSAAVAGVAGAAGLLAGAGRRVPAQPGGQPAKAAARAALAAGDPIRMGVIGTGGMGTGHCDAITALAKAGRENVQIVALCDVCDPRLAEAKRLCEERQSLKVDTYRKHEDLVSRPDLHGVLIASPEHWHSQHAIDALTSGKDVYVEKPMTLNLPDALRLYRVAKANPEMILQVGTQMMQLPKYHEARKAIEAGDIGVATSSQTSYCRNSKDGEWLYYAIDPAWKPGGNLDWDRWCGPLGSAPWSPEVYARWRRYRKYSTGIIGDLLVHVMTPLVHALNPGWPTRVVATGAHMVDKAMENHDQVNLTIEFESGHTMVVAGSTCNEVGLETMVRGHKGNLYLNSRHCLFRPERIFVDEGLEETTHECPDIGNDQDVHRLAWLRSIRTREQPASGIDAGTKIMVIVDLASRSMWEGSAFRFDPKAMAASKA